MRRYCSSGEPGWNGGAASVTSPGSESFSSDALSPGLEVFATMLKAAAMYEPPDTADTYFESCRILRSCSTCSAPRLNAADRMPPPEQQMPTSSRVGSAGS